MDRTLLKITEFSFMRGLRCPKALWLSVNQPELLGSNPIIEARRKESQRVTDVAYELFPKGINLSKNANTLEDQAQFTLDAIASNSPILYQAVLKGKRTLVTADILKKEQNGWAIYCVFRATSIKPSHMRVLSLCYLSLLELNIPVTSVNAIHLNTSYIKKDTLNLRLLFRIRNMTDQVVNQISGIHPTLTRLHNTLTLTECPKVGIGPYCDKPHACDFKSICWKDIPSPSIFSLSGIPIREKFRLYKQGNYTLGTFDQIHTKQRSIQKQINALKTQERYINKEAISDFVKHLTYPISYMDFEAMQLSIPYFNDTFAFEHIPFQFSVHIRQSKAAKTLDHRGYIATPGQDPRKPFFEALIKAIPPEGSIIVFDSGFEKRTLKKYADLFPEFRSSLLELSKRLVDISRPFKHYDFYDPKMLGSQSLKGILKGLGTGLDYEEMDISSGEMATHRYQELFYDSESQNTKKTLDQLKLYCELDTLALDKILTVFYASLDQ